MGYSLNRAAIILSPSLMRCPSEATQIIVSINQPDSFMRETIIIDLVVLLTLDHSGLESAFDAVAEFRALARPEVAMCLALTLLEVVSGCRQDLGRHKCLLDDPL